MRKITLTDGKFLFALALVILLWGIGSNLPYVVHPDEPHHLNVAARFGGGDLNPHDFKYPTLWPYLIAGLLGLYFFLGTVFNLVGSAKEFAILFLYSPTIFYLSVRVLSALSVAGAVWLLHRFGTREHSRRLGVITALFASMAPAFLEIGRETTPYAMALFLVCTAMFFLQRMQGDGARRDYLLSGLFIGLAASTHYITGVFVFWLVTLHFTRDPDKRDNRLLTQGLLLALAGFLIATPFALLDFNTFIGSLIGHKSVQAASAGSSYFQNMADVFSSAVVHFMDRWGIGFVLAAFGYAMLSKRDKIIYLAWLTPFFVLFPVLSMSTMGSLTRYSMASYPVFILLAAHGFVRVWDRLKTKELRLLFCAAVFFPLVFATVQTKRQDALIDTRVTAREWILVNIPAGSKVFLSDPFYCPQLDRSRPQIERLLKRTQDLGHPREQYFRYLLEGHKGGGYEIYYLKRTAEEALYIPDKLEAAYAAQDVVDLKRDGLAGLKKAGIRYVIIDEHGRVRQRETEWLKELTSDYAVVAQFLRVDGKTKGPGIAVFDLNQQTPNAIKKSATKA